MIEKDKEEEDEISFDLIRGQAREIWSDPRFDLLRKNGRKSGDGWGDQLRDLGEKGARAQEDPPEETGDRKVLATERFANPVQEITPMA